MPAPSIKAITDRTKVAEFVIEEEERKDEWKIRFRPFSRQMLRDAQQGDDEEQLDGLGTLLERVVVSWNLTDEEGKEQPFNRAYLDGWGLDYVRLILNGLMEAMQPPKASATAS